ncbi:FecR family protein [Pedobacter hiemivivus]|uniref:FecR family protein n=1 Tax=Pedobacter hiemivivus TaxID=2530454 RepID=A0A4R0N6V1_9SPHI|nr:FecR family protein [Pedobacter hiemivivus]TCC95740.1 FecR family protein [Pedobacter hiemivivus]
MTNDRINALIAKYFDGTLTEAERVELNQSYDLQSDQDIEWMADSLGEAGQVKQRMLSNIGQEIFSKKVRKIDRSHYRFIYAAAVLLLVVMAWLFFKPFSKPVIDTKQAQLTKIKPGSNKAILTLGTGGQIVLDHIAPGKVVELDGVRVLKTKEGQVVFTVVAGAGVAAQLGSISTPKGGQYEVVLPDGTKVWLNSASSIQFPTAFTGTERKVSLEGEAYFEVAKNKAMPFKVKTNLQEIEVLGTHFNIMAYDNENSIKTTLVEGSVKVSSKGGRALLKPGQQAELNKINNHLSIQEVYTRDAIAWKSGIFMFAHEDIRSILNKISRWYDVEVIYKNTASANRYSGSISRFEDVTEVLKTMEMTGTVHFEIKGRRIYVMD